MGGAGRTQAVGIGELIRRCVSGANPPHQWCLGNGGRYCSVGEGFGFVDELGPHEKAPACGEARVVVQKQCG